VIRFIKCDCGASLPILEIVKRDDGNETIVVSRCDCCETKTRAHAVVQMANIFLGGL
jgi:hypothetical protein